MTILSRVIAAREALLDDDPAEALRLLSDLERDLARTREGPRCPVCKLPFSAPGLVQKHVAIVHPEAA